MDELIKYVNSKNIQPRLWSGLNVEGSSYGGTTPVSNEAVFHFWARSFANLKLMLEGEYPMINNIDGYLYIVPAAGYQNYLNIKNLYDTWEAGKISNDEIVKVRIRGGFME
jgi:hexosaminidase